MNDSSTIRGQYSRLHLEHVGRARELWPVVLVNAVLNLLTLSFYRFWAKTKVRRFLWHNTTLNGEPFEYTGTGKELFIGFLIVFFAVILPLAAAQFVLDWMKRSFDPAVATGVSTGMSVAILQLIGLAIYRARRYRLTRTLWRGIRGNMAGGAMAYAGRYLGFACLNVITLGLTYPFSRMRLFGRLMRETTFGDRQFTFAGSARQLYPRYLLLWVPIMLAGFGLVTCIGILSADRNGESPNELSEVAAATGGAIALLTAFIVIYGLLALVWYRVREMRHFADCTRFADLSFSLDATSWSVLRLAVGNLVIVLLTLGFGAPFTQTRVFRYVCNRLTINGSIDIDAIVQSSAAAPSFGEGLADAFDLGAV